MKNNKKGFTLIELMIVVAIIGILAAIAIPKFADLISKAKEGSTKGALSSVRSAIQVYYGDNEGWFPAGSDLATLTTNAKYIAEIPMAKMPGTTHADSRAIAISAVAITDAAGWNYANDPASSVTWGNFVVACTHEDIKGRGDSVGAATPWSTF